MNGREGVLWGCLQSKGSENLGDGCHQSNIVIRRGEFYDFMLVFWFRIRDICVFDRLERDREVMLPYCLLLLSINDNIEVCTLCSCDR